MLLEYEVYVDEKGYAHNDEGDSWYVGKRYGGETYAGTRAPWSSRRGRGSYRNPRPRKTSYVGADANAARIKAVEDAIAIKPNNFLDSILKQLKGGRGLSSKQNAIVRKILSRNPYNADATLFEGKGRMKTEASSFDRATGEGSLLDYEEGYKDGMSGADIPPGFAANPSYRQGYDDAERGNYNPPEPRRFSRHRRARRM